MVTLLIQIVLRVVVIYFVVLVGIRLTGKREVGQMSPFDLVLLLLIANAVQNAMTGPDTSLAGGITAALTLFAVNALVAGVALKHPGLRRVLEGTPTLLIHNGEVIKDNLKKEELTYDILEQALREHGVSSVADVKTAVLEVDGSVSVIRNEDLPVNPRPHHRFRILRRK